MSKKVEAWRVENGKLFSTEESAKLYERKLKLLKFFQNTIPEDQLSFRAYLEIFIKENIEELDTFLSNLYYNSNSLIKTLSTKTETKEKVQIDQAKISAKRYKSTVYHGYCLDCKNRYPSLKNSICNDCFYKNWDHNKKDLHSLKESSDE